MSQTTVVRATAALLACYLAASGPVWSVETAAAGAEQTVTMLQRIAPGVRPPRVPLTAARLAGRYSSETPALRAMIGGFLSGSSLYLFRDGAYLYLEWTDTSPEEIQDRGRWTISGIELLLQSDGTLHPPLPPQLGKRYAVVEVRNQPSVPDALRLVNEDFDIQAVEADAKDAEAISMFFLRDTRQQIERFSERGSRQHFKDLMQRAWNPDLLETATSKR